MIERIEYRIDESFGGLRELACAGGCFQYALNSPFLPVLIRRFSKSVSEGNHQITRLEPY